MLGTDRSRSQTTYELDSSTFCQPANMCYILCILQIVQIVEGKKKKSRKRKKERDSISYWNP